MKSFNIINLTIILLALLIFIAPNARAVQNQKPSDKVIKIGLLIPDDKLVEARFGAEMAIDNANKFGGVNGHKIQLVTRSMAGVWGTGSKQAVDLIFNDNVWAILGSIDGRNAHLVEQATTKTRVVFLSAWASDPTLSEAFVPWFFNLVPNDNQQAASLIDEIYNQRKISKLAIISERDYDSEMAAKKFVTIQKTTAKTEPLHLFYKSDDKDFSKQLNRLNNSKIEGIVLFAQPQNSAKIIKQIQQISKAIPVFGTLSLMGEVEFKSVNIANYENVILINSENLFGSKGADFKKAFQNKFKKLPGAVAAYAFDGMNLIIEAIRISGRDSEKFLKTLSAIHYNGVTGAIQFDAKGNRLGKVGLMQIKNGIPLALDKQVTIIEY